MVESTDDIAVMKKVKEENDNAFKLLESKIDILDKEIKNKMKETQQGETVELHEEQITESEKRSDKQNIVCRYSDKGYCRKKSLCMYKKLLI